MTDADLTWQLENWAQWVRARRERGHCRSFERFYRTPRGAEVEWEKAAPLVPMPSADALAAVQVEACMRLLPDMARKALKFVYLYRADARWCTQRLGVRRSDWPGFLEHARTMLGNVLAGRLTTRTAKVSVRSQYLPIPSPDETPEPARLRGIWAEGTPREPA